MVLTQPVVDAIFQDGCLTVATVTLAMYDAHATNLLVPACAYKVHQFMAGDGGSHAMHVEFGANFQLAAPELLQFSLLDTGACKKQRLVGGNFAGIEIIGEAVGLR